MSRPQLCLVLLVVYGVLVGAGVFWLSWRDRTAFIAEAALGRHGPAVALVAGTLAGLAFTAFSRLLSRYVAAFARLDARLAGLLGPIDGTDALVIALASGAAEEFFFRCAMQDALGLLPTAVLFGLAHVGGRGLALWSSMAFVFGLALGGLVHLGCGVLAAAIAHAVFNYLWLLESIHRR
ncbi:MAG: CPBP family intramembrane glutamic endopeptidase [Planctomycetota bacterium]